MKKIKRIMAVLICMTITLTGIPVSVNAENSGGKSVQTMETGNELFITLEENTRYRWNVNDSAEKNSVVHLDTSGGDNCRFRLDHIENEWYGIKHIKVDGTDRFADVDGKSKNNGAVLHLWESSDSKVKETITVSLHFIILVMMQMEMRGTILKIETVENGSDMKEN